MNYIAQEILSFLGISDDPDILMHYGVARRSGRYAWGSGENPYQHSGDFLSRVEDLRSQGMTEKQIADAIGLTTTELRVQKSFADDCDAAAVHLKAAALPRQKYQVILPLTSIKETEVYAPYLPNGETVALVRFPHGGTFEIPILKVNNKVREGIDILGKTPKDAIGINAKVAEQLSGADFDGDTVMVIPCNSSRSGVHISSQPPLEGLKGFDPKLEYGSDSSKTDANGTVHYYRGGREFKVMTNTQNEMGRISNLITDMTLKGATPAELAKAVRHSMVVIDAEKHKLDYKQSELDNDIATLKRKYQGTRDENGRYHEGASTLLSRAKSETSVPKRQGSPKVNQQGKPWYDPSKPEGALVYNTPHETYTDKKGKVHERTQQSTKMMETPDARTLISDADTPAERAYANYANQMKALANTARKEMVTTGRIEYTAQAKAIYRAEYDSLEAKLNLALANAPRERRAQILANAAIAAKKKEYPDMTPKELKKAKNQALMEARLKVGSKRNPIDITDREWEAIQAGAISENKLMQILNHTDLDKLRERATPRARTEISSAKAARIKALKASGYTIDEIAQAVGVSSSTVVKNME